jgi:predicted Zn finger-like uncharacterized protein
MRLTCPNCSARYEVDASMIPPEGRDVQCSNCGTTWFQAGSQDLEITVDDAIEPDIAANAPAEEPRAEDVDDIEPDNSGRPEPTKRGLDPSLQEILREEAAREASLRRAEGRGVETQEELGLSDAAPAAPAPQIPEADPEFDEETLAAILASDTTTTTASAAAASRRDLLPDIEEINSTLRSTSDRVATEAEASDLETVDLTPRRRRGFRVGFGLILLLTAISVAIYANTSLIVERVPSLAEPITGFVEQVDVARLWFDDLTKSLAEWLNQLTSG